MQYIIVASRWEEKKFWMIWCFGRHSENFGPEAKTDPWSILFFNFSWRWLNYAPYKQNMEEFFHCVSLRLLQHRVFHYLLCFTSCRSRVPPGSVSRSLGAAGSGCRAAGDGAVLHPEPGPLRVRPGSQGHLVGSRDRAGGNRRAEHSDRPHLQPEGVAGAVHGPQTVPWAPLHCGTGGETLLYLPPSVSLWVFL